MTSLACGERGAGNTGSSPVGVTNASLLPDVVLDSRTGPRGRGVDHMTSLACGERPADPAGRPQWTTSGAMSLRPAKPSSYEWQYSMLGSGCFQHQ